MLALWKGLFCFWEFRGGTESSRILESISVPDGLLAVASGLSPSPMKLLFWLRRAGEREFGDALLTRSPKPFVVT